MAAAQSGSTIEITPLELPRQEEFDRRPGFESVTHASVQAAPGAVLKALDKVSGEVREIELAAGERARMGLIEIALGECRVPVDDPASDAFAWVEIQTPARGTTDFSGWMVASSPALNALDHARYDVWVMRCTSI